MNLILSLLLATTLSFAARQEASVPDANTAFGLALYQKLAKEKGNIFFSPYSVSSALAMTSAGAKGKTLEEMNATLRLPKEAHKHYGELLTALAPKGKDAPVLEIANRLWTRNGPSYRPEFLALAKGGYGAEPQALDYKGSPEAARKTINAWVEKITHEKITNLMPAGSITEDTDLVLTNAIYFKGKWKTEFRKAETRKEAFFPEGGNETQRLLMHASREMDYAEDSDFQAIQMPYKGDGLAMGVLLPREGKKLSSLEGKVTPALLEKFRAAFRNDDVVLTFPKFRLNYDKRLEGVLPGMGMALAFSDKADFSGVRELKPGEVLALNVVVHKAFVEVDEQGTEAAAATGVGMVMITSVQEPSPPKIFKANRPFLFWIEHIPTKSILFFGRMAEPSEG